MLDTGLIRRKIDGLSAADGADTYWRDRMIEVLDEIDDLRQTAASKDEARAEGYRKGAEDAAAVIDSYERPGTYLAPISVSVRALPMEKFGKT